MPRIIVLDDIAPEGLALLDDAPEIEYEIRTGLKGEELRKALCQFDGAVCRSGVKITADALQGNRALKAIVRAGVGTDNIDKAAATRAGIVVMNTPTGNTISTAEHAFALMLGLARNLAPANQSLVEGRWDRKKYMGSQLAGKTIGVIGLGRIGQEVAKRAQAFEMRVLGFDPFLSTEHAKQLGIEKKETVDDLLPEADFVTVHTPLTPETKGLIGAAQLERLKPGVRLINCARGGIYDESALAEGLASGRIAGVALDVYAEEPCTDSPLFGKAGSLCTPHLGASTEEAQTQVAVEACQLLIKYLIDGEIRHAVNVAALDPKTLAALRGYLDVAYRLGGLLAQWHAQAVSKVRVEYRGDLAGQDTKLLTSAFCAGLLEQTLDEEVNIINAEMFCQERGISLVSETNSSPSAFRSSMTATVVGDDGERTAGGTLFGREMPRLFLMDGFRLEAFLDGHLLILEHHDVPGIVGKIGTLLAEQQVNIAQMAVGRDSDQPGGNALGVLNLDAGVSAETLGQIQALPEIQSAHAVELPPRGALPPWLS